MLPVWFATLSVRASRSYRLPVEVQQRKRAQEWAELLQVCAQVLDELTATAQTQEARLLEVQRQRAALEARERSASAVEIPSTASATCRALLRMPSMLAPA